MIYDYLFSALDSIENITKEDIALLFFSYTNNLLIKSMCQNKKNIDIIYI